MTYNRTDILALKLKSQLTLKRLSRNELLSRLQIIQTVNPIIEKAYERVLHERHVTQAHDSPHGHPWHSSFHACLTGDTEIVTRQGIRPIRELVGEAELLIPIGVVNQDDSRSGRGQKTRSFRAGRFEAVPVRSFGEYEVFDVHLRRGRQTKTVTTTSKHRWQLKDTNVVETSELQSGDKLKSVKARVGQAKMVPFAVAQGFVFGDGTARRTRRDTAWIDIHHNGKDEAMLSFFHGHSKRNFKREERLEVTQVQNLPRTWKKTPDMDESGPFLLSWLAGYFAADGSVSKAGQATLTSASREAIDCARGILSICGVGYGHVNVNTQNGTYPHGQEYTDKVMYSLSINVRDLPDWFFVLPKHATRVCERLAKKPGHQHDWEVVSVAETGRVEEVFCPTTPTGFFALSDELLTGNSQFPGDDPMACPRESLYRMMDFASADGAASRRLHLTAEAGKAIEFDLVSILHEDGILISAPPDAEKQTNFMDAEAWLTGTVDSAIIHRNKPLPIEIKTKHESDIEKMRLGVKGPDDKHVKQIKTQLGLVRAAQEMGILWENHDLCDGGYIYYMPRDTKYAPRDPVPTAEFFVEYDARFFEGGLAKLKQWKAYFMEDVLPELKPPAKITSRSHPNGWKWSQQPCQWCKFKAICKLDHQQGIVALSESVGINRTQMVRPHYDPDEARKRVIERWEKQRQEDPAEESTG